MFTSKMRAAAPSAAFVTTGRILGYVLSFNKKSEDGSGKGNIVATGNAAHEVWGVIFEIPEAEQAALDKSEGGYDPSVVDVLIGTESVSLRTYVAKPHRVDNSLKPYTWYKDFVVRGAEEHRLSASYVEALKAVEAMADSDMARERSNRALLAQQTPDRYGH